MRSQDSIVSPSGTGKLGIRSWPKRQLHIDHLGDGARPADGVQVVGEEGGHLGRRLQIELVRFEPHPPRRIEVVAGADAQQDVVGLRLLAPDVVQIVGDDVLQPDFRAQPEQLLVEAALLGQAVVLQLEEEAVRAKDVLVLAGQLPGQLPVVDFEGLGDLAAQTGR